MSDTTSFVDPVWLAQFGLSRVNAIDYFLHPLNPFKTQSRTSNETLIMQGASIGMFMQQGHLNHGGMPMTPQAAEELYNKALQKLTGEQYELLPPVDPAFYVQPSPLYTIKHILRTGPTSSTKVLGVYYIVEGVIYKSPTIRALMKSNVARTLNGLAGACSALSACARYLPSTGYTWNFEGGGGGEDDNQDGNDDDDKIDHGCIDNEENPVALMKLYKRHKRRKILDHRPAGERTEAEEEGSRAAQAMDQILVRLSKSPYVLLPPTSTKAAMASKSSSSLIVAGTKVSTAGDDEVVSVAEPSGSANSSTTGVLSTK